LVPPDYTKLEDETREEIDQKLIAAGWVVQDKNRVNLYEQLGVAVRDKFAGQQIWATEGCPEDKSTGKYFYQMDTDTDTGPADYMLFVDGKACGIPNVKFEDIVLLRALTHYVISSLTPFLVDFLAIKQQGGWKDDTTVWGYIEEGRRFSDNAALTLMAKMETLITKGE
jgi:hypothetical protein